MYDLTIRRLVLDKYNCLGSLSTGVSAAASVVQTDNFQKNALFAVSFVVGVLTAFHLALQIRQMVRAILKEKRK